MRCARFSRMPVNCPSARISLTSIQRSFDSQLVILFGAWRAGGHQPLPPHGDSYSCKPLPDSEARPPRYRVISLLHLAFTIPLSFYNFFTPSQLRFEITWTGCPLSPKRCRSERTYVKKRATLKRATLSFFSLRGRAERLPCSIVGRLQDGFRLQVGFGPRQQVGSGLRRGQLVDLILDQDPSKSVRCRVVWIGEPGSKQEEHVALETVQRETS